MIAQICPALRLAGIDVEKSTGRYVYRVATHADRLTCGQMEPLALILLAVLVFVAVVHTISNRRSPSSGRRRAGRRVSSRSRPDPLVLACLGDRSKADRLALYEKKRTPLITDAEARARALERLSSDRS